jgi:DNA-directed RNA polymerase specialized sigma24 family protein
MKTWDDVKYLYFKIAKKCSDGYADFLRLYELDDIVGEVWLLTYPYINGDIKTLVRQIYLETKYLIHKFYRQKRRGPSKNIQDCTEIKMHPIEDMDFPAAEHFEVIESVDVLETVIPKLSIEERVILLLRYFCEWTEVKIGQALAVVFQGVAYPIPSNVISYRLKCIIEKIRKELYYET